MGLFGRRRPRDEAEIDGAVIAADHDFTWDPQTQMEVGCAYWITYECRDIGYGIESGYSEFVYRGGPDWTGKFQFDPLDGEAPIYLFPDEIKDAWR
jgi:hypothetical protein